MEVSSVTYFGWRDGYQTVEKRTTFNYEKGNDVTIVESRSYLVTLYNADGTLESGGKGTKIDQMV